MLGGNKIFSEKLGKMSAHCGSFELHNTEKSVTYTIDHINVCGELRLSKVVLALMCEIQSGWETTDLANAHTAEVVLARLVIRKLNAITAITFMKNRSAMIYIGRAMEGEQGYKPASLERFHLENPGDIEKLAKVYYSALKLSPNLDQE